MRARADGERLTAFDKRAVAQERVRAAGAVSCLPQPTAFCIRAWV